MGTFRRSEDFDADYYERGVQTGKSLYENYRWLGDQTVAMAQAMVEVLQLKPEHKVLDYGCAKGYLVRALRILGMSAWGVDISRYAIGCVDPEVRSFCAQVSSNGHLTIPRPLPEASPGVLSSFAVEAAVENGCDYDMAISKDVLEHIPYQQLPGLLSTIRQVSRGLFAIVPLGDGERFIVPEYEDDPTHEIRESMEWWQETLERAGWRVERSEYLMPGIKDAWAHYPKGNGFFICYRSES
ncbi:MAG: class I SAM-dependent methyltransferase [Deltaproteobacteria bacterium]|nr:class I SAM-dependent methyltransferase [Deltaproteobacteria bacterium]